MKNTKMKIMFFIFLVVFAAGVILLTLPFNFENYTIASYKYTNFTGWEESGFNATVYIDNKTSETQENVSLIIDYVVEHMLEETKCSIELKNVTLNPGENEFNFTYKINDHGFYDLEKIETIYITLSDGTHMAIKDNSLFSGPNWYFLGMVIIGFFGSAVSLIMWKVLPKVQNKFENASESFTSFTEKVKEAFKPLTEDKSQKEEKKYYCGYCKCTFDSKYDKCPHCGAPPERKD